MKIKTLIVEKFAALRHIRRLWKVLAAAAMIALILDVALWYGIEQYYPDIWSEFDNPSKRSDKTQGNAMEQKAISDAVQALTLNSKYAILIDMEDQSTLYEKDANAKIYPASLTKVLTAIMALDLKANMHETAQVDQRDLGFLREENASVAGLEVGDVISYEQALYALILPSGADAANFLANHLAGSIEDFVSMMNDKARALGMTNTHFMNTTGLHEYEHYTTLQDMKTMMMHAWKNPVFRDVMTTLQYTIKDLPSHPNGLTLKSTLMYQNTLTFQGGAILGGKTGYTPEAGRCLISIAKMEDNHLYMLITAKAEDGGSTTQHHMQDAMLVYQTIANTRMDKND